MGPQGRTLNNTSVEGEDTLVSAPTEADENLAGVMSRKPGDC